MNERILRACKRFQNTFLVTAGTSVLAFGTAVMIVPYDLVAGGVSGVSIVLSQIIPTSVMTFDAIVTVLTWGLFLLGFFVLGRSFAAKTVLSALLYPFLLSLFLRLVSPDVLGGFFMLTASHYGDVALFLAALIGGVLVGVGCAMTFLGGGSTGGVDILAFAICKYVRGAKYSTVIFAIDAITVLLGVAVIGDLVLAILGVITALTSALVIDRIFLGGERALAAQIVSEYADEINESIISRLSRSTTILEARGGYSGEERRIVFVSFSMRQYAELVQILDEVDPHAFVTFYRVHTVNGEGWTR